MDVLTSKLYLSIFYSGRDPKQNAAASAIAAAGRGLLGRRPLQMGAKHALRRKRRLRHGAQAEGHKAPRRHLPREQLDGSGWHGREECAKLRQGVPPQPPGARWVEQQREQRREKRLRRGAGMNNPPLRRDPHSGGGVLQRVQGEHHPHASQRTVRGLLAAAQVRRSQERGAAERDESSSASSSPSSS